MRIYAHCSPIDYNGSSNIRMRNLLERNENNSKHHCFVNGRDSGTNKMEKREIQAPKCEIFLEFRMRNIMRLEGSFKNSMKSRAIKLPACIQWLLNIMHNPPTPRGCPLTTH